MSEIPDVSEQERAAAFEFFSGIPEPETLTLTITALVGSIEVGQRLSYAHDTNRVRRRVVGCVSGTTFLIKTFIRPSRGFARHNRKLKRKSHA